jgi:hypothetical protein
MLCSLGLTLLEEFQITAQTRADCCLGSSSVGSIAPGMNVKPRHPSSFTAPADQLLRSFEVARAATDPPKGSGLAAVPAGWTGLSYRRLTAVRVTTIHSITRFGCENWRCGFGHSKRPLVRTKAGSSSITLHRVTRPLMRLGRMTNWIQAQIV